MKYYFMGKHIKRFKNRYLIQNIYGQPSINLNFNIITFVLFSIMSFCLCITPINNPLIVQAFPNNVNSSYAEMTGSENSNESKIKVINELKNLQPPIYNDTGYADILYSNRRDRIVEFINNLYYFLKTERTSTLLTDKDFDEILDHSVRSTTKTINIGDNKLNLRIITYEGSAAQSLKKNWVILQYWDSTSNIVKVIDKESNYSLDGEFVQILEGNPCITLYGTNYDHCDAIIKSYVLKNNEWQNICLLTNVNCVNQKGWNISLDNDILHIQKSGPENIIFFHPNDDNISFSLYENISKSSIEFVNDKNYFTLKSSDDINLIPIVNMVSSICGSNYISANIRGTSPSNSSLEIRLKNDVNKNVEEYIKESSIKIINYFFSSFDYNTPNLKGINIIFEKLIDSQNNINSTIEIDMSFLNYESFIKDNSLMNHMLKYATINGSSYENYINPGLLFDVNYNNYLSGNKCEPILNNLLWNKNMIYHGFCYDGDKIYHKFQCINPAIVNDKSSVTISNTFKWIKIDASNGKAYDITFDDNEMYPIN